MADVIDTLSADLLFIDPVHMLPSTSSLSSIFMNLKSQTVNRKQGKKKKKKNGIKQTKTKEKRW